MTEFEHADISRRLALAIGWKPDDVRVYHSGIAERRIEVLYAPLYAPKGYKVWRDFDYRNPAVIWPIAERFDCFQIRVNKVQGKGWIVQPYLTGFASETAAQAVALAVITEKETK